MGDKIVTIADFRHGLMNFIDELIEMWPTDPSFVIIRIFVGVMSDEEMMKRCTQFAEHKSIQAFLSGDGGGGGDGKKFDQNLSKNFDPIFNLMENIPVLSMTVPHYRTMYEELDDDERRTLWKWIQWINTRCHELCIHK